MLLFAARCLLDRSDINIKTLGVHFVDLLFFEVARIVKDWTYSRSRKILKTL
jgi:hypothetical protein